MIASALPYQCLQQVDNFIVAARGSSIDLLRIGDGCLVHTWEFPPPDSATSKVEPFLKRSGSPVAVSSRAKKPRLVALDNEEEEIRHKEAQHEENDSSNASKNLGLPIFTLLEAANHSKYVMAVTGEDKTLRLFEIVSDNGIEKLAQVSQRMMPKRPCALAITADDSTVICADKFGDVYALPLSPSFDDEATQPCVQKFELPPTKSFVPAANEFTIHSQRNRKALENQKRHVTQNNEKPEPSFEHKLLLGHVSMLTDVKLASGNGYDYIITADRDEHIRVSRGLPHAHIIEGFCLGHNEFVSRLCIPKNRPNTLVSGGGQDDLFVWNWLTGRVVCRVSIFKYLRKAWENIRSGDEDCYDNLLGGHLECPQRLAVSGIHHVYDQAEAADLILVTCEAIPAILSFILKPDNQLEHVETFRTPGNILAIVANVSFEAKNSSLVGRDYGLLASIDTLHLPGMSRRLRGNSVAKLNRLYRFDLLDGRFLNCGPLCNTSVACTQTCSTADELSVERFASVLYTWENLRKRGDGLEE